MTEIELITDLHKTAARQAPGSEADTLRALGCTKKVKCLPYPEDLESAKVSFALQSF